MKQNPYYAIEIINGVPYLLPFGQSIAEMKHGFKLNETGVFLWEHLEEAESEEHLLDMLLNDSGLTIDDDQIISSDLYGFLEILKNAGVIVSEKEYECHEATSISIAGIKLTFYCKKEYIPKQFDHFIAIDDETSDLAIVIETGKGGLVSGETILIHNNELNVYEGKAVWHLEFPAFDNINGVVIDKRFHKALINIRFEEDLAILRKNLFHVVRHIFLLKAQSLGLFAIHSASILYRGKAFLFSGPSGTGKTTHTRLWKDLFGVKDINGDLNLVSDEGRVFGTPWCGTSEIFTNKNYILGGLIFLKQAKKDTVKLLEDDEKVLRIVKRIVSPIYTKEQLEENIFFAVNISKRIPAWRLYCTKNDSAAELMKDTIDGFLNRSIV